MAGQSQIEPPAASFAWLLRQLRVESRMTQEELAYKAGLSPRSISDLERGISRTARNATANLLADALAIGGSVRMAFVAAARGRGPVSDVLGARAHSSAAALAAPVRWYADQHVSLSPLEIELFEKLIDTMAALRRDLAAIGGTWLLSLSSLADSESDPAAPVPAVP